MQSESVSLIDTEEKSVACPNSAHFLKVRSKGGLEHSEQSHTETGDVISVLTGRRSAEAETLFLCKMDQFVNEISHGMHTIFSGAVATKCCAFAPRDKGIILTHHRVSRGAAVVHFRLKS